MSSPTSKLSDADLLLTSRRMLYGGLAFLPLLWLVHVLLVFPEMRRQERANVRTALAKNVKLSAAGVVFWLAVWGGWWIAFAANRQRWGAMGDMLTVVIPQGR
ncbi:hypothetical protein RI367_000571 [Sorochytrium milnesiophthora]